MAVMASSAFDNAPFEAKSAFAPVDAIDANAEANGLFDSATANHAETAAQQPPLESQPQPTMNGTHPPQSASTVNVPDSQTDTNSLFGGSEIGATSIPNAVEAPTSDVRDEAASPGAQQTEPTQQVLETQPSTTEESGGDSNAVDAMDVSQDEPSAPAATSSATAPSTEPPSTSLANLSVETQQSSAGNPMTQSPTNIDQEMGDAPSSGKVRSREDDDIEDVPDAKRTRTDENTTGQPEFKVPDVPAQTEQPLGNGTATAGSADQGRIQIAVTAEEWPDEPLTKAQNKFLLERVRNTKKIKVAYAFKDPVNPETLNIPTYFDHVKEPMDLSTMENKLKQDEYPKIIDFMKDLDQVINNSVIFNGKDHPITQAGYNMRAYFLKGLGKMPRAGVEEQPKQPKPKKPTVATSTKPRRESRAAATAKSPTGAPPSATSPQTTWPLNQDGLPLIRRDSSSMNDRPKREIHRPPPKDLPYNSVKPKKKKFQNELRFCESVVSEMVKPKYQKFTYPFLNPVDPVALNIPQYLKIIKKPMDFGTIEQRLKDGQYQNSKEFHNDALLVFNNCYKFNPEGDEVNKMGHLTHELFNSLWNEKAAWIAQHAPASDPQSPASASSDEEEEEEEEEEDSQAQIRAIQEQIAQLNETAQQLLQQKSKRVSPKVPTKKGTKNTKAPKQKKSTLVPPPKQTIKPKGRSKPAAPLSFAQKQEISDGISTLNDADMRKAVQIIRNGCPHLANVNDDEMEIDMDEIGDETLRALLRFIKEVRGPTKSAVVHDDDFEPRPAKSAKTKKNKPMGKKEQEDSIKRIQEQLKGFEGNGSGSSQSPPARADESSDDDDDSASESEEE